MKNGLKTLSLETITTLSGTILFILRNIAIIFPVQSKYYGENNILKKILSTLTGIEKFALINKRNSSAKSALKFLTQGIFFIYLKVIMASCQFKKKKKSWKKSMKSISNLRKIMKKHK